MYILSILLMISLLSENLGSVFAEPLTRCSFDAFFGKYRGNNATLQKRGVSALFQDCQVVTPQNFQFASLTYPVYFTIVRKGQRGREQGVIDTRTIQQQFNILQSYYSTYVGVHFQLADIRQVYDPAMANQVYTTKASPIDGPLLKKYQIHVPNALHIVVTDFPDFGIALPGCIRHRLPAYADVVVLGYNAVIGGPIPSKQGGKTLLHEVGHWLGLFHAFQDRCDVSNDFVADTAPQTKSQTCALPSGNDLCPGVQPKSAVGNLMNYQPDNCRGNLTFGQISRMRWMAMNYRKQTPVQSSWNNYPNVNPVYQMPQNYYSQSPQAFPHRQIFQGYGQRPMGFPLY
jgi:hypothetical protein